MLAFFAHVRAFERWAAARHHAHGIAASVGINAEKRFDSQWFRFRNNKLAKVKKQVPHFSHFVIPNEVRNLAGSEVSALVICLGRFLTSFGMTPTPEKNTKLLMATT